MSEQDSDSNPIAKEVDFQADTAIASFVKAVGQLGGLDTTLEIENHLDVPLHRVAIVDGYHPASGAHGSGEFPDNAPVDTLDAKKEGLTAVKSTGAGAIALVVYRVGEGSTYIVCYTGRPDVGTGVGSASILYCPSWKNKSHAWLQSRANWIMACTNITSRRTSNTVKGMGLQVTYTITGSDPQIANFKINLRDDPVESFVMWYNKNDAYLGGAYSPTRSTFFGAAANPCSQAFWLNQPLKLTDPIIWEWRGPTGDWTDFFIATSGQDEWYYLNYRAWPGGGRAKLYNEASTSHMKRGGEGNRKFQLYSIQHGAWLRADDEGDVYFDVDDENKLESSWSVMSVTYKGV